MTSDPWPNVRRRTRGYLFSGVRWFTPRDPELRRKVLAARGRTCAYCGTTSGKVQVDHIRPLWAGGEDSERNAQVLCLSCHERKTEIERPIMKAAGFLQSPGFVRILAILAVAAVLILALVVLT